MTRPFLFVLVGVVLAACRTAPKPEPAEARRPDVLVVVLDTVRADMLSTYGYNRLTSPQLDAVAEAGVVFEDVTVAGSWTWPGHASLFTGMGPWANGAHASMAEPGTGLAQGQWGLTPIHADIPTLAERFADAGYRTVSLAANRFLDPSLGLTRGFQTAETLKDHALVKRARALMAEPSDKPLFLFVNLLVAHAPWEVYPAPWSDPYRPILATPETAPPWTDGYLMEDPVALNLYQIRDGHKMGGFQQLQNGGLTIPDADMPMVVDLYAAGLLAVDFLLNSVLSQWTATRPSGIVAVTSDHGEYLGEHGLWEHGKTVYTEVIDVPLVIAAPGRLPAGKRVTTPVQMHDLHDTVLDLAGIAPEAPGSLVPIIAGAPRPGPILAKAWTSRPWKEALGGIFAEDWWLYREGNDALIESSGGTRQLFDLGSDPQMTRDLAAVFPDKALALSAKAATAFTERDAPAETVPMSDDVIEELRALGYVE